jgi:hypothetical protein
LTALAVLHFLGAVADEDRLAAPFDVSDMPGSRLATSTSMEASASVEASGRIWSMNGQATAPTRRHTRQIQEIAASPFLDISCSLTAKPYARKPHRGECGC